MYLTLALDIYETDVRVRARERERQSEVAQRTNAVTHTYTRIHTQDEEQDYVNHEAGIMRSNDLQITGFA